MVNPTGYTALDLIGFTDKGAYAANVNYVKNDLVHHGGNIWRILIDDTIGITPAEGPNYTLFIGEPTNLIERIIAPLEDNPATVAYQTGRQIIYNDYLYEVIQNIAVGDILIAYEDDPTNANIKLASPVETQVLALDGRADALEGAIAPVESNATASRAYAIGEHFIKDGAFCTAKAVIERGEAFTLNANYTAGTIASSVAALESEETALAEVLIPFNGTPTTNGINGNYGCFVSKVGNVVNITGKGNPTNPIAGTNTNIFRVPEKFRPKVEQPLMIMGKYNGTYSCNMLSITPNGYVKTFTGSHTFTDYLMIFGTYVI